jgi:AAA family ATP:ADP antiporter
MNSQLH